MSNDGKSLWTIYYETTSAADAARSQGALDGASGSPSGSYFGNAQPIYDTAYDETYNKAHSKSSTQQEYYGFNDYSDHSSSHDASGNNNFTTSTIVGFAVAFILLASVAGLLFFFSSGQQNPLKQFSFTQNTEVRTVTSVGLNLRSSPGPNQPVIHELRRGEQVSLTGQSTTVQESLWVKVRVDGWEGWVNEKFLN